MSLLPQNPAQGAKAAGASGANGGGGGAEREKFRLTWNDFGSNVAALFSDLRARGQGYEDEDEDDFHDVVLAARDGEVRAHRFILGASSPLFRRIFRSVRRRGGGGGGGGAAAPVVYLKGVSAAHLHYILDFMYYGEVNLEQDELQGFLAVAEELQVKGLAEGQQGAEGGGAKEDAKSSPSVAKRSATSSPSTAPKRQKESNSDLNSGQDLMLKEEHPSGPVLPTCGDAVDSLGPEGEDGEVVYEDDEEEEGAVDGQDFGDAFAGAGFDDAGDSSLHDRGTAPRPRREWTGLAGEKKGCLVLLFNWVSLACTLHNSSNLVMLCCTLAP